MADTQTLDFTNVKEAGAFNTKHQPSGDYEAHVTDVKTVPVKNKAGKKQWLFTIKVGTGTYPYYCQFEENTLWKIRNLFVAGGFNIPKKRMKVDPTKMVGKTIGVTLEDDEYEGKMKSVINAVFPASELEGQDEPDEDEEEDEADDTTEDEDEEEDEEEPPPPPKSKKKKGKKKAAEVTDDELEELDIEDI